MIENSQSNRKLAAIMFTDIVGYSKLVQENEDIALTLLDDHNSIVRPILSNYSGEEVKTIGDAFLVQFDSAINALKCAEEIQKQMIAHNAVQLPEKKFQIRIGIHVGDVVFKDGDVFGDGVNIASRVEPHSIPGGICITEQVYSQVNRKTELTFISIGSPTLKNISDKVELYQVELPWLKNKIKGKSNSLIPKY